MSTRLRSATSQLGWISMTTGSMSLLEDWALAKCSFGTLFIGWPTDKWPTVRKYPPFSTRDILTGENRPNLSSRHHEIRRRAKWYCQQLESSFNYSVHSIDGLRGLPRTQESQHQLLANQAYHLRFRTCFPCNGFCYVSKLSNSWYTSFNINRQCHPILHLQDVTMW